jgi:DNA-binding transcriptional ArsR family regulator
MKNLYTEKQAEIVDQLVNVLDSKFFKSLGEPVRVELLRYLLLQGRTDIGTISQDLPQDRSVISRHLNLMYEVGLLNCEKESRHMYYSINASEFLNRFTNIAGLVKQCIEECGSLCCK